MSTLVPGPTGYYGKQITELILLLLKVRKPILNRDFSLNYTTGEFINKGTFQTGTCSGIKRRKKNRNKRHNLRSTQSCLCKDCANKLKGMKLTS